MNGLEDTRKECEKECGGYWDTSGGRPEVVAEEVVAAAAAVVVIVVIVVHVDAVVVEADMGEAMWLHRYSPVWVFSETTWYYSLWTPDWIFGGYSWAWSLSFYPPVRSCCCRRPSFDATDESRQKHAGPSTHLPRVFRCRCRHLVLGRWDCGRVPWTY